MSRDIKDINAIQTLKTRPIQIQAPSHNDSLHASRDDLSPILVPSPSDRCNTEQGPMIQPEMIKVVSASNHQSSNDALGQPRVPNGDPYNQPGQFQVGMPMNKQPTFAARSQTMQNFQDVNGPSNYETSQVCIGQCTGWLGTYLPCICCCPNPYKTVPEGHSGVIMRFGKFYKLVGPGMHYLLPDVDTLDVVDKREKVMELPNQNVVSKDNTSFSIDAVIYYKIVNTYKSRFAVAYLDESLRDLAVTSLRNTVGKMTIQQFLELKDHFAEKIQEEIVHAASSWGVKVARVLVQDVSLPLEFRNSFSTGALAKKISEAQVISSQADVQVAKLMKDAADALNTDAAFQIRYITALEAITNSGNPKMIFFPSDFNDVGTVNQEIIYSMEEETEGLVKKRQEIKH